MKDEGPEAFETAALVGVAMGLLFVAWLLPQGVAWLYDGSVGPTAPVASAITGTMHVFANDHWHDPASAFPAAARAHMPDATGWWLGAGMTLTTVGASGAALWRSVDRLRARSHLARRPYDVRGSRPRSWARPRDVPELGSRSRRGRFSVGVLDGRRLHAHAEAHIAVVAPTRSGKTTRCVIPWILEHEGPVVVTSTKTDVIEATRSWRAKLGRVAVWDPFSTDTAGWSPLAGCQSWSYALRQARWLADAAQEGESEVAAYWRGEAAKLLAPLLHAAAVGGIALEEVVGWVDRQDTDDSVRLLNWANSTAARDQLRAVLDLDARNRGTTYMSAGSLLAAYRFPEVAASARPELTPSAFFDGGANTIYLVAPEHRQRLLAPLAVALLSSLFDYVAEHAAQRGPLTPSLRILMDEAANVSPLRDLPAHLSQAAGHGIRIATIWQSLGQMRQRYGAGAETILANSTAKVFMGPVTDEATRTYLSGLLGEERIESASAAKRSAATTPVWRSKADAATLQQLGRDRAVLVEGSSPPAVVHLQPWWDQRKLRRRGR